MLAEQIRIDTLAGAATILAIIAIVVYVNWVRISLYVNWVRISLRTTREATPGSLVVMIDGENMPAWSYEAMELLLRHQHAPIKRIYADWGVPATQSWRGTIKRHALDAVSVIPAIPGKNATDIHLTIDAIHLGSTRGRTPFVIASSDTDFIPLYKKLRLLGHQVIVVSLAQTPVAVQNAVDEFVCVVSPRDREKETDAQPVSSATTTPAEAKDMLVSAWRSVADDDGWAYVQDMGRVLTKRGQFETATGGRSLSAAIKESGLFMRRLVENRMQVRCTSET